MDFPLFFWISLIVLAALITEAVLRWDRAWAKPAVAVYFTVGAWYPGNLVYSGIRHFQGLFSDAIIQAAILQFILFLVVFRLGIPIACKLLIKRVSAPQAGALMVPFHQQISPLFWSVFTLWIVLFLVGTVRLDGDILPVIWPPLSHEKVSLFVHEGIGGKTGFITAIAQYSYQLSCAFFGVAFVLSRGWIRVFAILLMCFTWPYFLFDRARSSQLAIFMPMLISYLLLGQARLLFKSLMATAGIAFIYCWFILVSIYRSDYDMTKFLSAPRQSSRSFLENRHMGLDMMEELCNVNLFIERGTYKINYGERYLHEVLNVIPRAIWNNKPLLGFDYAVARGFMNPNASFREAGVVATVSTGMIGQGVVNFGRFFGAAAAALLMSLWVGLLARHWSERWVIGKTFLFILGLGLTFNLGRDITLLVLWPFVFASFGVWFLGKYAKRPYFYIPTKPSIRNRSSK